VAKWRSASWNGTGGSVEQHLWAGAGMQLKAERSGGALCLVEWRSDSTVAIDM
jgi:hypothetical protein